MKTIIVTSQKGGSGKTTLATHLAVEAERKGDAPAWLIDTDKQGTLSLWHERREAETPQRADLPFSRLEAASRPWPTGAPPIASSTLLPLSRSKARRCCTWPTGADTGASFAR